MQVPNHPKIYHIVHVNRLPSIVRDGYLWCDAEVGQRSMGGTTIGMNNIKKRRLEWHLWSYPDFYVGDCVPFYFCPRSVMLFVIYQRNHEELTYRGGQELIVHLEADLRQTVEWANSNNLRWAFTDSNAASGCATDWCDLAQLNQIDWNAVRANQWGGSGVDPSIKDHKQAEFLVEQRFPWELVSHIGVYSQQVYGQVMAALRAAGDQTLVTVKREWYY